jgi:hypothetical protein
MGNYLFFELNRYLVRREMQALINSYIPCRRQLILKIYQPEHNPDFKRIDSREIKFKGRLYDVIHETKQGKNTVFCCIHDKKEEQLMAGSTRTHHRKINLALFHTLVSQALPSESDQGIQQHGTDYLFPEKNKMFYLVYLSLFVPPPENS